MLVLATLFFNGCVEKEPCPEKEKLIYTKVPKLRILYSIKQYKITDISTIDETYYKVNIEQLKMASAVSQKRNKNIKFYEEQNYKFNRDFADKNISREIK